MSWIKQEPRTSQARIARDAARPIEQTDALMPRQSPCRPRRWQQDLSPSLAAARFPRFTTPNNEAVVMETPASPTEVRGRGATKQHCRCLSASDDVGCRNRCTAASAAGLARWCRRLLHDHVEMLFRVNVEPGAAADLQEQRRAGEETCGEGSLGEALLRPSLGGVVLPSPPPSSTSAGVEGSVGRVDSREDESLMCHAHAREENEEEKNSWGSSRWTTPSVTGARTATCDQCLLRKYGLSSTCTCAFVFLWRLAYAYAADVLGEYTL